MSTTLERVAPFQNEPIKSYTDPADIAKMQSALASVKARFGKTYPLVIDGERIETEKKIPSLNPANPAEIVGKTAVCFARTGESRGRGCACSIHIVERDAGRATCGLSL